MHIEAKHNQIQNDRLSTLTGLRGVAAICIVLHHYTAFFFPAVGEYINQFTPFFSKSYLWVDFFFLLSGFILTHVYCKIFLDRINQRDYFSFIGARLARIYPLHIIALLLLVFFEFSTICFVQINGVSDFGHPTFSGKHSIGSIFTNIFLVQAFHEWSYWNEPAWAISAQWMVYIIVPILLIFSKKTNICIDAGIILLGFIALFLLASHNNGLDFVSWRSVIRCLIEAFIGILTYKQLYLNKDICLINRSWFLNLFIVLIIITLVVETNHVVTVLLFCFLISSASKIHRHIFLTNRIVLFLGTISYSIYMTHWILRDACLMLSFFVAGQDVFSTGPLLFQCLLLSVSLLGVVMISAACYYWIEQPLHRALSARLCE